MAELVMLISCVMPTSSKRRGWIPLAVECYLQQSYKYTELIVGGEADVLSLLPDDPRIRFVELADINIGMKRNALNSLARGELIAHWDDDDWYAPWRLASQIGAMFAESAPVSGHKALTFYDVRPDEFWRYQSLPDVSYACGATLLYERSLWESLPFGDQRTGEDARWCDAHKAKIAQPAIVTCIASTHAGNTCKRVYAEPCWRRLDKYEPPDEAEWWLDAAKLLDNQQR